MTQHLTSAEEGVLFRLISKQFYDEKGLPREEKDLKKTLRKIRIITDEDVEIAFDLIDEFFIETKEGYINEAYQGKLKEIMRKSKSAQERGKRGGRPKAIDPESEEKNSKKLNKKLSTCLSPVIKDLANPEKQPINNNQEPINNNQEETTNPREVSPSFEFEKTSPGFNFVKFIESYPKQTDNRKKTRAAAEWRYGKHEVNAATILKAVTDRIAFSKWREWIGTPEDKFIPDPANFLKNRVYDEEFDRMKSEDEEQEDFLNTLEF